MLMHTKGILVMTPDSAMVLTGKQALDYSGSVSAEDNLGIGGYERIMGQNGQGQYWAPDLPGAISRAAGALRPRLRRCRRAVPASRHDVRSRRIATSETFPHHLDASPIHDRRRHLLRRRQPGAQAALRHPHRDACGDRPGPRPARALARPHGRRHGRRLGRQGGRLAGRHARHRGHGRCAAAGILPGRRPRPMDVGDPVSDVVEEGGPRRQRGERQPSRSSCWRTCPASTARPSRCGRCSSSSAPRSAGPSSTSAGRSCSSSSPATTAAPSSCSRRASTPNLETIAVEGAHASVIGGDARCGRSLRRRGRGAVRAPTTEWSPWRRRRPRRGQRTGAVASRGRGACRAPSTPRSSAKSPPSSIGSTASNGPSRWARSRRSFPPIGSAAMSSTPIGRGVGAGAHPHWAIRDDRPVASRPGQRRIDRRRVAHRRRALRVSRAGDRQAAGRLAAREVDGEVTARDLLDAAPHRVEVRAADDGAPDALLDGAWPPDCHSACRIATASPSPPRLAYPLRVGIDLETLETALGCLRA